MRISRSEYGNPGRVIDLAGPSGNGMNIIATAVSFERQLERAGIEGYDSSALSARMFNQSYDENVALLEERFGDYVTIVDVADDGPVLGDFDYEDEEDEDDAEWDEYWAELDAERDD